jgi:orotate phosphoribosyltransferase-like protein
LTFPKILDTVVLTIKGGSSMNPVKVPIYTENEDYVISISYGRTLYAPETLRKTVKVYVKTLTEMLNLDKEIDGICSTGSSGAVLAGAIMMSKLPRSIQLFHVNKRDGHGHGGAISGSYISNSTHSNLVFVDDFISEGGSLAHCVDTIKDISENVKVRYALVAHGKGFRPNDRGVQVIWAGTKVLKVK